MSKVPITVKGAQRLRETVKRMKAEDRPRIIQAIAEARAHGDLSENAEYHAAREEQSFIEGRIAEIEHRLADAQIIDVTTVRANGKVVFGATIELVNMETDEECCYQIVGDIEADINEGLISINSPISRALIGKMEGDVAQVEAPGGTIEYEILVVRYE